MLRSTRGTSQVYPRSITQCHREALASLLTRRPEHRTWEKPAAPCLASRVAYGITVTPARLARIERAEGAVRSRLHARGQAVRDLRVRDLGEKVRLELDAEAVDEARGDPGLVSAIRAAGFGEVPVDVQTFRTGSLNELLDDPRRWRDA